MRRFKSTNRKPRRSRRATGRRALAGLSRRRHSVRAGVPNLRKYKRFSKAVKESRYGSQVYKALEKELEGMDVSDDQEVLDALIEVGFKKLHLQEGVYNTDTFMDVMYGIRDGIYEEIYETSTNFSVSLEKIISYCKKNSEYCDSVADIESHIFDIVEDSPLIKNAPLSHWLSYAKDEDLAGSWAYITQSLAEDIDPKYRKDFSFSYYLGETEDMDDIAMDECGIEDPDSLDPKDIECVAHAIAGPYIHEILFRPATFAVEKFEHFHLV